MRWTTRRRLSPPMSSTRSWSGSSVASARSIPRLFSDNVSNEIRANAAANTQARGVLGFNVALAHLGLRQRALPAQRCGRVARRCARERDPSHSRPRRSSGFPGCASVPALLGPVPQVDRSGHPANPECQPADGCLRTTIDNCARHTARVTPRPRARHARRALPQNRTNSRNCKSSNNSMTICSTPPSC